MLQECYPSEGKSVSLLRDLRREIDSWQEIDPESELSLLDAAINAVATMIEIYRRRFYHCKVPTPAVIARAKSSGNGASKFFHSSVRG